MGVRFNHSGFLWGTSNLDALCCGCEGLQEETSSAASAAHMPDAKKIPIHAAFSVCWKVKSHLGAIHFIMQQGRGHAQFGASPLPSVFEGSSGNPRRSANQRSEFCRHGHR